MTTPETDGEQTEAKKKSDIPQKEVKALARALFQARNQAEDAPKQAFKDVKAEINPVARRAIRKLRKQGYVLTPIAPEE